MLELSCVLYFLPKGPDYCSLVLWWATSKVKNKHALYHLYIRGTCNHQLSATKYNSALVDERVTDSKGSTETVCFIIIYRLY